MEPGVEFERHACENTLPVSRAHDCDGPYTLDLMGHQREDVAADGWSLVVENSDDFPIVIVQNWPLELGRLMR